MTEITVRVDKAAVYAEVSQTTEYTGAKMPEADAYERISTTDEDASLLDRFWEEAKSAACGVLKRQLTGEEESGGVWTVRLSMSGAFAPVLRDSIEWSFFAYFVSSVTAKWFTFTNKEGAEGYAAVSAANMEDIRRKVYHKRSPERPSYD